MKGIRLHKEGNYYKYTLTLFRRVDVYWGKTDKQEKDIDYIVAFRNKRKFLMRVNLTKQQLFIGSLVIFTIIMAIIELSII
jgi:hypothetical protein